MTTVSVVGNSVKLSNAAGTISLLPRGADLFTDLVGKFGDAHGHVVTP